MVGVRLNKPHLQLWGRFAIMWGVFVVFCLIAGWHLKPRTDEVLAVATLPLWFLIPYIFGCLIIAYIRLWAADWNWRWWRKRLGCPVSGHSIADATRRTHYR